MTSTKISAQQGDPEAIAICLKVAFPLQPIEVEAQREQNLLILQLWTLDILEETQTIKFLEKWLTKLNPSGIHLIQVQAQIQGQDRLAWQQSLTLKSNSPENINNRSTTDIPNDLKTHYQQLNLEPGASLEEIDRVYFQLKIQAKRAGNFKRIQTLKESYLILTTHLKEKAYERQNQQLLSSPPEIITTSYAGFSKEDADLMSFNNRFTSAIIFPMLLISGFILNLMPLTKFLLRGINIWFHEFGHAIIAWLSGRRAIPLPIGWTNFQHQQSSFVYWGILFLLGLLFFSGWKEKRYWSMVLAVAIAWLQFWMTWLMSPDNFYVLFSFSGIGGEFCLCAFLMVNYFFALPEYLRWDFYRFPVVLGAAFTFWHQIGFWHQIDRGQAAIPWGTIWGGSNDSGGDMNLLIQYGWNNQQIIDTYNHLGDLCIIAIAVSYFYFAIKQNRHAILSVLRQYKIF